MYFVMSASAFIFSMAGKHGFRESIFKNRLLMAIMIIGVLPYFVAMVPFIDISSGFRIPISENSYFGCLMQVNCDNYHSWRKRIPIVDDFVMGGTSEREVYGMQDTFQKLDGKFVVTEVGTVG